MEALRLQHWKSDPELVEVAEPRPGPGQVVVRIGGAGACHSDLHLMREFDEGLLPWEPPFTLGHKNAGWVHALGEGVAGLVVGQPVAVYGPWGCGRCARCLLGMEGYCEIPVRAPLPYGGGGLGLDGGMAEFMLVPAARNLVPLPEGLELVIAAPLTDAALTPYHAVRRSWQKLSPGTTAVVIGIGGLGHLAVQLLTVTTATRVVAVDARPEALALAQRSGADHAFGSDEGTVEEIRAATGGRGADVVLDCVGNDQTLALGAAVARPLGDLTIIGLGGGTLPVSFFSLPYELSVQTTYGGSRPELIEVLDLAARGLVHTTVTTFPLERALSAYQQLAEGELTGRAVVVPTRLAPRGWRAGTPTKEHAMSERPPAEPGGSGRSGEEGERPRQPATPPGPPEQPPQPQYGLYPGYPQYPGGPPPPGYGYPAQRQPQNGFGITAMVTGIIGLALFWIPLVNLVLGVVAVVFGVLGMRRVRAGQATNSGQALTGLVTGLVAVALAVALVVFAVSSDSLHYYFS